MLDEKVPLADDNAYGLLITDFDGDGRVDLSYLVPGGRESLRVRLQAADGKFGPEVAFPLKTPRSPLLVVPEGAVTDPDAGSGSTPTGRGPLLASVLGGSGQVEFTRLVPAESDDRWRGLAPRAFSPLAGARGPALYTTGDFNRDGASDVAVAFGETAQIFIYLRDSDGGFTLARRVPSLTDAKGLAALSWSAGEFSDRLFVLSGKENALAEIALADDGTALPPRALSIPGRLIGFAAGNLSSGLPGFAVVAEEDAKRALTLWTRDAQGVLVRGATFSLATLRTDPRSVTLGDLNQDGRADVLLGVPAVGVRVLLQTADGGLVDAADNPAYRPGLLGRPEVISAPLSWGDVDGDGKDELLVGAENFIRALRIDESGALAIAAQFDARDIAAEVTTGFVLAGGKAATDAPRVILYDRKADQLHLLERAPGDPAYETSDVRSVARLDVVGATQLRGPEGRRELLLLGRDRFWWMPEGGADFALQSETLYASDLPEVRYLYAAVGDFDRDGRSDLVALDTAKNLVEILSTDSTGGWVPQLHFRVFETDPHFSGDRGGGQEPRECVIADVNADGKPDLVLLVHDRVLVYPQE
ncbi:MAG: VCBS repeat-containing protein [Verrucomicrobia bacterium]|nr:MAG: VCBS repeat-containing protein [Verrucomicrobiota bacterium]